MRLTQQEIDSIKKAFFESFGDGKIYFLAQELMTLKEVEI